MLRTWDYRTNIYSPSRARNSPFMVDTFRRLARFCRILSEVYFKCLNWLFRERPQYYELDSSSSLVGYGLAGTSTSIVIGNPSRPNLTKNDDTLQVPEVGHEPGIGTTSSRYISVDGEISPFDVGVDLKHFVLQPVTSYSPTVKVPMTSSEIPQRLVAALKGDMSEMRRLDGDKIIGGSGVKLVFDKLDSSQLRSICLGIRNNTNITSLELGCNNIGNAGATIITECLRTCRHFRHLSLWGNDIGDSGMCSLGDLVSSCPLETLILSNNEISDQGIASLRFSLASCQTLRLLDLSVNSGISDSGLGQLVKVLKDSPDCRLESLSLNNGNISDLGCQYLGSWLSQPHCPLISLDLSFNAVEDAGTQALAAALQINTKLIELNLNGNLFTKLGMKCLLKSIGPDHQSHRTIFMEDVLTSQF